MTNQPITPSSSGSTEEKLAWVIGELGRLTDFIQTQVSAMKRPPATATAVISADAVAYGEGGYQTVGAALNALASRFNDLSASHERFTDFVQTQVSALAHKPVRHTPVISADTVAYGEGGYNSVGAALSALLARLNTLGATQSNLQEQLEKNKKAPPAPPVVISAEAITVDAGLGMRSAQDAINYLLAQVNQMAAQQSKVEDFYATQFEALKKSTKTPMVRSVALSAEEIVYHGFPQRGVRNVEEALLWLVGRVNTLQAENTQLSEIVQQQLIQINQKWTNRLNETRLSMLAEISRNIRPVSVAITSNPALRVNGDQDFSLDLDRKGSFDDTVAALGANTLQQAIERLAQLGQVSPHSGNQMRQEVDGLYVPGLTVTMIPDVEPVSRKNGTLNLSPAVIAHRRGEVVIDKPDAWVKVTTLDTRVWDTLGEVGQAMAPLNQPDILIRRTGYYLCDAPLRDGAETSIVVNGKILEVGRHYGLLGEGSEVGLAVRTSGNGNYSGEFDLFVKLMA